MKGPRQVNIHEAKTKLSRLIAEVEGGREVVLARDGKPVAKLVPFPATGRKRLRMGDWKDRLLVGRDFDAPLSEKELKEWGF